MYFINYLGKWQYYVNIITNMVFIDSEREDGEIIPYICRICKEEVYYNMDKKDTACECDHFP